MQLQQQIRDILRTYNTLPGLVLTTLGFFAVLEGAISILFVRWLYWVILASYPQLADPAASAGVFLPPILCGVTLIAVLRYYKRRFGGIKASEQARRPGQPSTSLA